MSQQFELGFMAGKDRRPSSALMELERKQKKQEKSPRPRREEETKAWDQAVVLKYHIIDRKRAMERSGDKDAATDFDEDLAAVEEIKTALKTADDTDEAMGQLQALEIKYSELEGKQKGKR